MAGVVKTLRLPNFQYNKGKKNYDWRNYIQLDYTAGFSLPVL